MNHWDLAMSLFIVVTVATGTMFAVQPKPKPEPPPATDSRQSPVPCAAEPCQDRVKAEPLPKAEAEHRAQQKKVDAITTEAKKANEDLKAIRDELLRRTAEGSKE